MSQHYKDKKLQDNTDVKVNGMPDCLSVFLSVFFYWLFTMYFHVSSIITKTYISNEHNLSIVDRSENRQLQQITESESHVDNQGLGKSTVRTII